MCRYLKLNNNNNLESEDSVMKKIWGHKESGINGDCKNSLGDSAVDWDFYESTCNHIHKTLLCFSRIFAHMTCEHVCIIFICGLPHIQTHVCTCTRTSI